MVFDEENKCRDVMDINWQKVQQIFAKDEIISMKVIGYNRVGSY